MGRCASLRPSLLSTLLSHAFHNDLDSCQDIHCYYPRHHIISLPEPDPFLRLLPTASVPRSCKDIGEAWMQCVKDTNCYKSGKSIRICIRQDPEACNVSIRTSRIP
jgi:hypothetical protein